MSTISRNIERNSSQIHSNGMSAKGSESVSAAVLNKTAYAKSFQTVLLDCPEECQDFAKLLNETIESYLKNLSSDAVEGRSRGDKRSIVYPNLTGKDRQPLSSAVVDTVSSERRSVSNPIHISNSVLMSGSVGSTSTTLDRQRWQVLLESKASISILQFLSIRDLSNLDIAETKVNRCALYTKILLTPVFKKHIFRTVSEVYWLYIAATVVEFDTCNLQCEENLLLTLCSKSGLSSPYSWGADKSIVSRFGANFARKHCMPRESLGPWILSNIWKAYDKACMLDHTIGLQGSESIFHLCVRSKNREFLHLLISKGNKAVVKAALHKTLAFKGNSAFGYQVSEIFNVVGFTPLHLAALEGETEVIHALLRFMNPALATVVVKFPQFSNFTPLHLAAWGGHIDTVKLILSTPEYSATSEERYIERATGSSDKGAVVGGYTPLLCAVQCLPSDSQRYIGCLATFKELLARGASVAAADAQGQTALHHSCLNGSREFTQVILIEIAALVAAAVSGSGNEVNGARKRCMARRCKHIPSGNQPCALCIESDSVTMQTVDRAVVANNLGLNAQNSDMQSPLHLAVEKGHLDIVRMLHPAEDITGHSVLADLGCQDRDGNLALHLAAQSGRKDIVKYLLQFPTQIKYLKLKNEKGYTAMELAKRQGHDEVVALFRETAF